MILTVSIVVLSAFVSSNQTVSIHNPLAANVLSDDEKAGLIQMREEEKMAFEVYSFCTEKWDVGVFKNIVLSEKKHENLIKEKLDQFGLTDPYIAEKGKYTNERLQLTYEKLIQKASQSVLNAYLAGAEIEDMDIADLDRFIDQAKNEEVIEVFNILRFGSENHMRAFNWNIKSEKGNFTPSFIDQKRFNDIVAADSSNCHGNKKCGEKQTSSCKNQKSECCRGNKDSCSDTNKHGSCRRGNKENCAKNSKHGCKANN